MRQTSFESLSVSSQRTLRQSKDTKSWVLLVLFFVIGPYSARAQSGPTSTELLQSSLKTLGGIDLTDVVLTGTATFHAGSADSSVTASLRAQSSGSIQITYDTASNPQVEVRTVGSDHIWTGNWQDSTGTIHPIANHNMMAEPEWFFPLFELQRATAATNPELQVTYVGEETFHATAVHHFRMVATSSSSLLVQRLAQTDLYLDAATLLPTAFLYNDHADNNALLDIPVTVLFSEYTSIHGVLLPAHVQQLRNNALFVDLHIQDIQTNTHTPITLLQ